jgi:Ca-activated chloride channel family protein
MSFIWPAMLFLLLVIPLFVLRYITLHKRRQQALARFNSLGFTQGGRQSGRIGIRRHIPAAFFMISLSILIFALARPETVVSLPKVEGTVILAFDISGSMAAEDLKPTRMEAAKVAARDFVERQPEGVLIGVVAFSDSGIEVQPPTDEQDAIFAAINRLTPQRGTSLGNGLLVSLNTIAAGKRPPPSLYSNLTPLPSPTPAVVPKGTYINASIILLSDGENNQNPNPLAVAQLASQRGVRIHTVGIGSPAGVDLQVDGFTIHTQLDEAMLQAISQITEGNYHNAENEDELRKIYENLSPELVFKPERTEVTSLFAGVGIVIFLIGGTLSLLWFSRLP